MGADYKEEKKKLMVSYAKREIIEAVIKIIDRRGVKELTMSKVAEEAGIAKGTLYLYFENKKDLVESTVQHSLEPLFMAQEEILDKDLPADEKLKKIARFHLKFFEKHKHYFRMLIYEHHRSQDPRKRFIDSKYQMFLARISEVIRSGIEQGLLRKVNPELLAVMFCESLIGVTLQIILQKKECDLEMAHQAIEDVFFNGIKYSD